MRAGLWRWVLALTFAGFLWHAAVCPCEVVHPHHDSTKLCIVGRVTRVATDVLHRAAAHATTLTDIATSHVAQLASALYVPDTSRVALSHLPFGISTLLLARGPPPTATTACTLSNTLV